MSFLYAIDLYRCVPRDNIYSHRSRYESVARYLKLALLVVLASIPVIKQIMLTDTQPMFAVDRSMARNMKVIISVDLLELPCAVISLSGQTLGGANIEIDQSKVSLVRLSSTGLELGKFEPLQRRFIHKDGSAVIRSKNSNDTADSCGDCYGAGNLNECCDGCDDVMYAYRLKRWALPPRERISQCAKNLTMTNVGSNMAHGIFNPSLILGESEVRDEAELEELSSIWGEGCRLNADLDIPRAPIQLHIVSGHVSRATFETLKHSKGRGTARHRLSAWTAFELTAMSDRTELNDGAIIFEKSLLADKRDSMSQSHQYYLTLSPVTDNEIPQPFRIDWRHFPLSDDINGAGVHFRIDFDPIRLIEPESPRFSKAFVDWLGFTGGFLAFVAL